MDTRNKLINIIASMCTDEGNRVWNEIYDMLEVLEVDIPEFIDYDKLWLFLTVEYGEPDGYSLEEYEQLRVQHEEATDDEFS